MPSSFTRSPVFLPFDRPTSVEGSVSAIDTPSSGSSEGWSFAGHQSSAPSLCTVTPSQGAPEGVSLQTRPSSQGGRAATFGSPA